MGVRLSSGVSFGSYTPPEISLNDLTDVSITSPATAQYLRYNGTSSLWENSFLNTDVYNYLSTSLSGTNGVTVTPSSGPQTFTLSLSTTGVGSGTYNNVTVNTFGRVTAGSNTSYLTGNQTITVSGDASGSGTTSISLTLANTAVTPGSYTNSNITVDSKGRITSISNGSGGGGSTTLTGDVTGSGTGTVATTLASTGVTPGTYQLVNASQQPRIFTIDAKGRITAITTGSVITPAWSTITATPTTLAGYGITDALPVAGGTMTGTIALNNNSISGIKNATFSTPGVLATTTGAVTVNWTNAQNYKQNEPTGAITYTFTAPPGPCHLQLYIDSDGTSTAQTFTWPGTVIWFGVQWTALPNKKAIVNFWYDGTNYLATGMNQV